MSENEIRLLKNENQNLKEIIEVAKQITSGLEIQYIIKNFKYVISDKFKPEFFAFVLPKDIDDYSPLCYYYKGLNRSEILLGFPSVVPLIDFFAKQEYNQISYKQFAKDFADKKIFDEISKLSPEFIIPLKSDKSIVGIYLQGKRNDGASYSTEDIHFCTNLVSFSSIAIENATLYRKATVDRMTKLFTHHQFQKKLEEEISKGKRYENVFSLVMFDIDHFKNFNDNYGHLQGDIIIKEIAKIILKSIRDIDFAARYGGEEFSIILPQIKLQNALLVAERLRKKVEGYSFPGDNRTFNVTISMGVIEYDSKKVNFNEDIIECVDKALYHSKEMGRNRLSIAYYDRKPELFVYDKC